MPVSTLFQPPALEGSRSRTWATTLVSFGIYGGIAAFVAVAGAAVQTEAVQKKLDVVFRAAPEPPPAPQAASPPQDRPRPKKSEAPRSLQTMPLAIPDAPPTASDPAPPPTDAAPAQATPADDAPPAPAAKPKDPINLPENATPPVADVANAKPEFPRQALSMGTGSEALVILKIVVDAYGNVTRVQVMKGDEPFVSAAVSAVKSWRYSPALVDGTPTAVFRIVKIPFRLRG